MPSERYTIQTPTGEEEHSAGGVVYRRAASGWEVLLVERQRYHDWSLPKGHLEPGETHEAAALREIEEETGIQGRIVAPLGTLRYPITGRSGRPTTKVITHFLVAARDPTAVPAPQPGEVDAVLWVPLAETATLLPWAGDQEMIALAEQKLTTETTESTE
jgi:8-oxo-dGTP pyrophosphatase MutT (NUDIX family)